MLMLWALEYILVLAMIHREDGAQNWTDLLVVLQKLDARG